MGKNKLQRFKEIGEFDHVLELTDFQGSDRKKPKGNWCQYIFGNDNPVVLELACGKGEYTIELALKNPGKNYVGVDIKGARIWKGAKRVLADDMENVRFLRIYIDHLDEYFAPGEVDEIWITFPDPYPNWSDRNKRLTSPKFLAIYQKVLKKGSPIHFKTDSDKLFESTLESLDRTGCRIDERIDDIYSDRPDDPKLTTKTYYEKKHLNAGKKIKYLCFHLPDHSINPDFE